MKRFGAFFPKGRTIVPRVYALALLANTACSTGEGGPAGDTPATSSSVGDDHADSATSPSTQATSGSPTTGATGAAGATTGNSATGNSTDPSAGAATGEQGTGVGTGGVSSNMGGAGGDGAAIPSGAAPSSTNTSGATSSANTGGAAGSGGNGADGGGGSDGVGVLNDTVTRTESTYTFQHFPIETNADFVWSGEATPAAQPTSTTFDTVVLENNYLRVTLLPSYGGRVLSVVHKPTERELLYQNPIGTPYLMYEDIFYYDYLVILGGIFPSFPEPEHGKYWNQPYDFEIITESPEAITVRMSRQDDLDSTEGVPERYVVGRTDVLVEVDVTLRAGRSNLELATKLTNTRSEPVPEFEYWTVTTLAPGSTPGDTSIPLNTRILAKMDQVHLLESSWMWFAGAEERISDEIFRWNNLASFQNWADQGTAFANPSYQANWSGLLNADSAMATLRVSDNVVTPGLKLWTFGTQSLDVDINDGAQWLRPTIEMWHGITPEFWQRAMLPANETRQWSDSYFLTLGMSDVTAASEYGAVALSSAVTDAGRDFTATATLTLPDQPVSAVLRLDGVVVAEQEVVVSATEPVTVSVSIADGGVAPGAIFEAEFLQGDRSLLLGQTAVD